MTAHDHREFVPGCFRCDLSREETSSFSRVTDIDFDDDGSDVRAVTFVPVPDDDGTDW